MEVFQVFQKIFSESSEIPIGNVIGGGISGISGISKDFFLRALKYL